MDVETLVILSGAVAGTVGSIGGFGGAWINGRSARAKAAAAVKVARTEADIARTEAGATVLPHMLERIGDLEGHVDHLRESQQDLLHERDDCVARLDEMGRRLTTQERLTEDSGRESRAHQEQLAVQGARLREIEAATGACVYRGEEDAACAPDALDQPATGG